MDPESRREFLFVRHGQTDWNSKGRLQGRTDRPLDATGIAQAQAVSDCLTDEPVCAIVSSPLQRASQTASIISQSLSVSVSIEPDLTERDFGALEGRLVSEITPSGCNGLEFATLEKIAEDTEPWNSVCERVYSGVTKWLDFCSGQRVLFVGHYGVFSALCQTLLGEKRPVSNAVPYRFNFNGEWVLSEVKPPDIRPN